MNTEDKFEQRLHRQPVKQIPPTWREEILSTARAATTRPATRDPRQGLLSTLNVQLSTFLWPYPKAWAGLAAVWLVVLGLNFAAHESTPPNEARLATVPSPEMRRMLKAQERLFAELIGQTASREAEPPKAVPPRPRSQRCGEILTA